MARFKQLQVSKIPLVDLQPQRERKLSPRQRAALERDDEIRAAFDLAATLPSSEAVIVEPREGTKLPTLRAAVDRLVRAEPRQLNWGVRGQRIVISKGDIPGGRRRKG